VDGLSPIQKEFQVEKYALLAPVSVLGPPDAVDAYLKNFGPQSKLKALPASNRDPSKLTTVVVTGVTALVRGTAATMFIKGITYPDTDIRAWLRDADITHVSNEIPFSPKCPLIHDSSVGLVFCTRPEFIGLLEDVNPAVIELTGDHFQDWGAEAMLYTIDLYKARGWKYYGGGTSLEDGRKPALFEHNGNKIAFVGCNGKAPGYAGASDKNPGAVHCDMKFMTGQIEELRKQGYNVITTFQHEEVWTYLADPALKPDFQAAADAGAVIVSGSQAHQPQAMEFRNGAFVHYGLGNLFFDQYYESLANRQAFIDRHVFYGGKYINTELLTMMFIDLARPRPMTPDERKDLLTTIFKASNW
jgi:poly-gamma-glutamate synthesis protein (capsule biosynthesis protein)